MIVFITTSSFFYAKNSLFQATTCPKIILQVKVDVAKSKQKV